MSDNRNYSVITNFGCHWQCPYCIVRNTGIQIAETRMGATYDTVMDLADSGKMKFLSFSGGGDPLWGLDIRRAYWYSSVFIVITLGVIAILCVLMLLGVFVCIFDHDDNHRNDKSSKE